MAAPRPPSLDEIEEDLKAALHTDVVFSRETELKAGRTSGRDEEVDGVTELATQYVLAHQRLQEEYSQSLPRTLQAVEQHISELRAAIGSSSTK